jgi:hypothetical protein
VGGFLARAAEAEAGYLAERFGPDYREHVKLIAGDYREID